MKQPCLSDLEFRFGRKEAAWWPWCLGLVTGMLVPAMIVVAGWIVELLYLSRRTPFPESIGLGPWLTLPSSLIGASSSPLQGLLVLIGVLLLLALIEAWALWLLYRWGIGYAVDFEVWLRREHFRKYVRQASQLGVAGQMAAWKDADGYWIPQIREGTTAWYRSFHRYIIEACVCFGLAICIHPMLMLLTFIAFVLVWRLYRSLDRNRRRSQPVLAERSHAALEAVGSLASHGPQLAMIHSNRIIEDRLDGTLRSFREAETKLGFGRVWRTPMLTSIVALIVALFGFVLSVHVLKPDSTLDVAAALTMLGLIAFGYVSVVKVARSCSRSRGAEPAAKHLLAFLDVPDPKEISSPSTAALPIRRAIEFEHVTFVDALGQKLLEDIVLRAVPGTVTAVVSTSTQTALALAEVLVGFGRPRSGRILWDGVPVTGLNEASLNKQRAWIEPSGPIVTGTVAENISPDDRTRSIAELLEAVREAGVYDAISELPDSFSTLLSSDDDRLKGDALFRLGVARALLNRACVVVAQEPIERNGATSGETIDALRVVAKRGGIVFVLPKRSNTLRQADQVVLLHERKIAAVGTHNELLESSDLYRHLNYMLFSPLRHVAVG